MELGIYCWIECDGLSGLRARDQATCANGSYDAATNQQPDRFVRGGTGKEPGEIGTQRVGSIDSVNDENDANCKEGQGDDFIHEVDFYGFF